MNVELFVCVCLNFSFLSCHEFPSLSCNASKYKGNLLFIRTIAFITTHKFIHPEVDAQNSVCYHVSQSRLAAPIVLWLSRVSDAAYNSLLWLSRVARLVTLNT
jgi:hypothetical protein